MIISQLSTRHHSARRLQCCFTATETIREGDHRSPTSSFTQLQGSVLPLQCCFTFTETIRKGDHRSLILSHSSRALSSNFSVDLRPQKPLRKGTTGHLPLLSHSSRVLSSHQCCFTSTETVGTVRDWSPGHRPLLSHNSGLCSVFSLQCCFTSTETIRKGDPRSLTSFTQLPSSVLPLQCCFTSTEIVREGDPRSPTSSFTQFRPVAFRPQRPW